MLQLKAFVNRLPEGQQMVSGAEAQNQLPNGVQLSSAQGDLDLRKNFNASTADVEAITTPKREDAQRDDVHTRENHHLDKLAAVDEQNVMGIAGALKQEEDGIIDRSGGDRSSEWVEQDESGVYITLVSLPNGGRDLKRVRFRCVHFLFCIFWR